MIHVVETNQVNKHRTIRTILLLLAIISSPLSCCGCTFVLDALPPPFQPPMMDLFEAQARVENRSGETLYITPITTTYGHPTVIGQPTFIRQRDIPLQPNRAIVLSYDMADAPLSGIAVCRTDNDCRLLAADHSDVYYLDSFENFPGLDQDWFMAIQSHPSYSFGILIFPMLSLLPVVLFLSWLYLTRLEKKRVRS